MGLPSDFNSFEFLQDCIRKSLRDDIRNEFKDFSSGDLDISTPRGALRTACTPQDNDNSSMLILRLFFFYFVMRRAQDLFPPIAGMPLEDFAEKVTFRPQVTLHFEEKRSSIEQGYSPLRSRLSIRIPNQSNTSITNAQLLSIAREIKSSFGGNTPKSYRKGKICAHYRDKEKGYKLQIYCSSSTGAKSLISDILALVSEMPKWEYLHISENEEASTAYPIIPPTKNILGESRKMPRKRPVGEVYFTYATAEIYGVPRPITLYATSGSLRKALVY